MSMWTEGSLGSQGLFTAGWPWARQIYPLSGLCLRRGLQQTTFWLQDNLIAGMLLWCSSFFVLWRVCFKHCNVFFIVSLNSLFFSHSQFFLHMFHFSVVTLQIMLLAIRVRCGHEGIIIFNTLSKESKLKTSLPICTHNHSKLPIAHLCIVCWVRSSWFYSFDSLVSSW